jgi:Mce-associated membrane protein
MAKTDSRTPTPEQPTPEQPPAEQPPAAGTGLRTSHPVRLPRKPRLSGTATRDRRPYRPAPPVRAWRLTAAALAVVLAAALVAAVVFGQRWYDQRQLDTARQQALAAAKQVTVNFVSISASTVDRDLQRIVSGATGEFKDGFTRGMAQVRQAVVENDVDSHGDVLAAAIVSGDRDSAIALVAVDATVKNVNARDGRLSHYRIQVDLARDGHSGRWLVSRLQFVG